MSSFRSFRSFVLYFYVFLIIFLLDWLTQGVAQKLVLVIKGLESDLTLERWVFDIECTSGGGGGVNARHTTTSSSSGVAAIKSSSTGSSGIVDANALKDVSQEISAVLRQITSSMTFLPVLTEPSSFDILVYTDRESEVPPAWTQCDPCYVLNPEDDRLRSINNNVHNVDVRVFYRGSES